VFFEKIYYGTFELTIIVIRNLRTNVNESAMMN